MKVFYLEGVGRWSGMKETFVIVAEDKTQAMAQVSTLAEKVVCTSERAV